MGISSCGNGAESTQDNCDPKSGFVTTQLRVTGIDKVDLLLVVDNSPSMADKQVQLARAIPAMVKSLTNPEVDSKTGRLPARPVTDLHLGVLSTSLGSHGTSACAVAASRHNDDHGHLLPRAGEGGGTGFVTDSETSAPLPRPCPTPVAASALTWVFAPESDPSVVPARFVAIAGSTDMQLAASCIVQSVGEDGCGYEETWESLYHFLVDPQPWLTADVACTIEADVESCGSNKIETGGLDDEVIKERRAFLRNDSLLSIVIVSDENDASLKPAQLNWLPWSYAEGAMLRGWKGCENVPDDLEPETGFEFADLHAKYGCYSCFENLADPGGNCSAPWTALDRDDRSLRAFHQPQRFGYNFLWSRQRYVDAFESTVVPGSDLAGNPVGRPNPLFAGGFRTPDLVVVSGIVGVPVSLVTEVATGKPKTLTAADWEAIASPDLTKRNPHMIESIGPRAGLPTFAGDRSVDPVSGGERENGDADDLQFACIGKRVETTSTAECSAPDSWKTNPLCDPSGVQPYFKAYPGLRHLRILHDLGANAFVGSICSDSFVPVLDGVVEKMRGRLASACFGRHLIRAVPTGRVDCTILESFAGEAIAGGKSCESIGGGYCTPGAFPCRAPGTHFPPVPPAQAAAHILMAMNVTGPWGVEREQVSGYAEGSNVYAMGSDGVKHLLCEEQQLTVPTTDAATADACLHDPSFDLPLGHGGFCYSEDTAVVGPVCTGLAASSTLRQLGDVQPQTGAEIFLMCVTNDEPVPATCK